MKEKPYYRKAEWYDSQNIYPLEHTFYVGNYEDVVNQTSVDYSRMEKTNLGGLISIRGTQLNGAIVNTTEFTLTDHLGSVGTVVNMSDETLRNYAEQRALFFLVKNRGVLKMGAYSYCRKCKKYKIPLVATLANLTSDGASCENCGVSYTIGGAIKLFYFTLEGAAVLVSMYMSFYFLTATPLAICIVLVFFVRSFFLPLIAKATVVKMRTGRRILPSTKKLR